MDCKTYFYLHYSNKYTIYYDHIINKKFDMIIVNSIRNNHIQILKLYIYNYIDKFDILKKLDTISKLIKFAKNFNYNRINKFLNNLYNLYFDYSWNTLE